MKLYRILMEHYAPKGSQQGIYTYLAAETSEDVYEWLKKENNLKDGRIIYANYSMGEEHDEDEREEGEELFKERVIRVQGCMYDEYTEYHDLYYGKTVIGWDVVNEGINDEDVSMLKALGVAVERA